MKKNISLLLLVTVLISVSGGLNKTSNSDESTNISKVEISENMNKSDIS